MEPANPIAAASHEDPYPYYERLRAGPALSFDEASQLWIAARASTVAEVFANPACRVRPSAEPVPMAIAGFPAGEVFKNLVRMNDGLRHRSPKLALQRALVALPASELGRRAIRVAQRGLPVAQDPQALNDWIYRTPVSVIADVLGFEHREQLQVARWTTEFVACLSPLSTPAQLRDADAAAAQLQSAMLALVRSTSASLDGLAPRIISEARAVGWGDDAAIAANLVGLLSQTYEATAGLIGNSIIALATHDRLLDAVRARADGWEQLVHESSRHDSPVQNTRRFVVEATCIANVALAPRCAILMLLGAANRDPSANSDPREFRLERPDRCVFTFGRGAHSCPGDSAARTIAAGALAALLAGTDCAWLDQLRWTRRASVNARLPEFHFAAEPHRSATAGTSPAFRTSTRDIPQAER